MPRYRAYLIDKSGRISGPAAVLECTNDQDVTQKAASLVDGHDIEVWDGPRFVIALKSKNRP